jgi:hypothetical protein
MSALESRRIGVMILIGFPSTPALVPLLRVSSKASKNSGLQSGYPE